MTTVDNSRLAVQGAAIAGYAQHYETHTIFLGLAYADYHTKLPKRDPDVNALNGLFATADVYLIAGNNKWQFTPGSVPPEVPALMAVGKAYPQFTGVVYDLEPQALPTWGTKRKKDHRAMRSVREVSASQPRWLCV